MATCTGNTHATANLQLLGSIRNAIPLCESLWNMVTRQPIVSVRATMVLSNVKALFVLRAETKKGRFRSASKMADTTILKGG